MSTSARHPSLKMLHRLGMIRHELAGSGLFNPDQIMYAVRIDGPLDLDRLALAWDLVQRRHSVLGCGFELAENRWRIEDLSVGALTLSRLPADACTVQRATEELAAVLRAPFDLSRGPLARLHAVPVGEWSLIGIAVDHIVCDAWSAQVLFSELWQFYRAPGEELAPVHTTFADLVAQERAWLASPAGIDAVERRARALADVGPQPTANLPGLHAGTATYAQAHRAGFSVSAEQVARLSEVGTVGGLAVSALAHAALAGALHLLSGEQRVGTTMAVANRANRAVHRTQGWLADNVVAVTSAGDVRGLGFIRGFAAAVVDAIDHSAVPFAALIARMTPDDFGLPAPHPTAAFNAGATLNKRFPITVPADLTLTEVPVSDGWGYRTIVVRATRSGGGLAVRISVKARWFERTTAELLGAQMEELLTGWAALR